MGHHHKRKKRAREDAPLSAKKSLGQHFLVSRAIVRTIVEAGDVRADETVVEIGPGTGNLTAEILARAARVIAVEKDERMAPALAARFPDEIASGKLSVTTGDALAGDLSALVPPKTPYKVIANIPYYITGLIVRNIFSAERLPGRVVLLVQREVGERVARERKGSILSMSVRAYGTPRYVRTVPAGNFSPRPKVDSAILGISDISRGAFAGIGGEEAYFSVLKRGFSKKRKVLAANLAPRGEKGAVLAVFANLGIPENARAEDLSVEDWVSLTKSLRGARLA